MSTPRRRNFARCQIFLITFFVLAAPLTAQEMEPGAYSRAPVGTNFVLLAYSYQEGDVLLDAALPLRDVSVKLHAGSIGYGRTFGLFGRQSNVAFFVPYVHGKAKGTVFEDAVEARRSGLADIRARFAINIVGSPAMSPQEFAKAERKTTIGASVTVVAPSGQYDPNRLVNIGANRWSFKPEIGLSKPVGRWTFEAAGGVWLATTNKNFFGRSTRSQAPMLSLQGDVLYTFKPRMWLAVGGTYFRGGRTRVNGVLNDDSRNNSRYGATFAYPLTKNQSLKIAFARGLTARFGGSLTSIGVAWQYAWF